MSRSAAPARGRGAKGGAAAGPANLTGARIHHVDLHGILVTDPNQSMTVQTLQTVVDHIDVLSYNVRAFRLRLVLPTRLAFEAGQFVIVHVPKDLPGAPPEVRARAAQTSGPAVKRAYSIASPPHEEGVIEVCLQHVEKGIASTFFWGLKPGMPVTISGPHGRFLLKQPLDYQPVFMATGTGVAPFRSMIQQLHHQQFTGEMWLLFGCRYEHALLYETEFRTLASMRPGFHYLPTVSRPKEWLGETGHIQQTFRKHFPVLGNREIYICGWLEIVKEIVKDLESFGVPRERIHYEEWA
ncbi:MAG: FAD-dependent oxidoreductase [Candidatus Omnitrophica bacterium]|nr:FAD-dependent oxidoreductase [Candidatus Omnitrophota bacterium]